MMATLYLICTWLLSPLSYFLMPEGLVCVMFVNNFFINLSFFSLPQHAIPMTAVSFLSFRFLGNKIQVIVFLDE